MLYLQTCWLGVVSTQWSRLFDFWLLYMCISWLWACETTNKMQPSLSRHPAWMLEKRISLSEFIYMYIRSSTIVNYKCPLKREIR